MTAFTRLSADIPVTEAPDSIDTLLVPGGVPADFTFASGTHDIPEELTPDTVPEALAMVRSWRPGPPGSPRSVPGPSGWPPSGFWTDAE